MREVDVELEALQAALDQAERAGVDSAALDGARRQFLVLLEEVAALSAWGRLVAGRGWTDRDRAAVARYLVSQVWARADMGEVLELADVLAEATPDPGSPRAQEAEAAGLAGWPGEGR